MEIGYSEKKIGMDWKIEGISRFLKTLSLRGLSDFVRGLKISDAAELEILDQQSIDIDFYEIELEHCKLWTV